MLTDTATCKHYFNEKSRVFHEFMSFCNIFVFVYFQRVDRYSNMEALLQGKEQDFPRVFEFIQYLLFLVFSAFLSLLFSAC